MFKKKKKEEENKLHTEYGILKNTVYMLKKAREYSPALPAFMGIGIISHSLMNYLWTFISKFILDILERQNEAGSSDIAPLLHTLVWVAAAEIVSTGLNVLTDNRCWYNMILVRMRMITERVAKVLSLNYQVLEQPDILDMHNKASMAANNNNEGLEGMLHKIYGIGSNALTFTVTLTTISVLDIKLILILAAISLVQFLFFRYTVKKDKKMVWDKLSPVWRKIDYMQQATQNFDYAKDIRLFGMKKWLMGKQHQILSEKQEKRLYNIKLWIFNSIFANGMLVLSTAAIYGILIFTFLGRDISIGDFTLYVGLSTAFTSALTNVLNDLGGFKQCSLKVDDFRSFIDLEFDNEENCIDIPITDKYVFQFKNVSYRYKGQEGYAIKNLNLTLEAGKKLAVVGLNGAGKTTFIKLLLRLYDPTEGVILLNGTDIRKFRRNEYYGLFSPVFQNVEIFAFPMAENISMKKTEETDRELSRQCAEKAGLKEKLDTLEKGVDTELLKILHDDGIDLSGGEKQKLALARALYKNAPVIVLDEPTAALDALAEYRLYKSFNEIIGGKSAVYISHRLSSTGFCDSIAMFKAGELIEQGTHKELLDKGGAYAEMFEIQAQYYKAENADENEGLNEGLREEAAVIG